MADMGPPAGSRAVLVGVSAYEYAEFPPIRAARNSLEAMSSLLSDPALCGWPPEWITVIANPISAVDLATTIADLAEGTTGVGGSGTGAVPLLAARFQSPPVKPCMRFSRTRLTDVLHRRCSACPRQ